MKILTLLKKKMIKRVERKKGKIERELQMHVNRIMATMSPICNVRRFSLDFKL